MDVYGIGYLIINTVNNKKYVGVTTRSFDVRYRGNILNTHNDHLRRSILKYGADKFTVIEKLFVAYSLDELNYKEDLYINLFRATDPRFGFNKKGGGINGKMSEETKKKISESNKGREKDDASCHQIVMICPDTGAVLNAFKSISQGCRHLGIPPNKYGNSIALVCQGFKRDAFGFGWMYVQDYLKYCPDDKNIINEWMAV